MTNKLWVRFKFYDTKQELHIQKMHVTVMFIWEIAMHQIIVLIIAIYKTHYN